MLKSTLPGIGLKNPAFCRKWEARMNTSLATATPSTSRIRVALVMLFLSVVILLSGYGFVREWSALQPALAAAVSIWLAAGVAAGISSLLLLTRSSAAAVWCGAVAAVVAGATLVTGVALRIVPCSGPTCVYSRLIAAAGLILFGALAPRVAS
jgi:riboflavin transporter FmnP